MDTITDVPSLRLFGDLYGTGCTSISLSDSAMIFVQNTTQHRDFGALVYDRTLYMIYCISLNPPTLGNLQRFRYFNFHLEILPRSLLISMLAFEVDRFDRLRLSNLV